MWTMPAVSEVTGGFGDEEKVEGVDEVVDEVRVFGGMAAVTASVQNDFWLRRNASDSYFSCFLRSF